MEDRIKISVICLTKNHGNYLKIAVESVLKQITDFKFEIIISDDASTDETLKIARDYEKNYPDIVRVISYSENIGPSKNAYNAMRAAKGDYLASCEGDDYWISVDKLQKQADFLDKHQNIAACYHSCIIVNENGEKIKRYIPWIKKKNYFGKKDFKGIFLPSHGVTWLRRNYFLNKDFDGSLIYSASRNIADRSNLLLWLEKGDFQKVKGITAAYRFIRNKEGKNLTSTQYSYNPKSDEAEVNYVLHLSDYLDEKIDNCINIEYYKEKLCTKIFLKALINRDQEKLALFKTLKTSLHSKTHWFFLMPYYILSLIWYKIRLAG